MNRFFFWGLLLLVLIATNTNATAPPLFLFNSTYGFTAPAISSIDWTTFKTNANASFDSNWAIIINPADYATYAQFDENIAVINTLGIPFVLDVHSNDKQSNCPSWCYVGNKGLILGEGQIETINTTYSNFIGIRFHEVGGGGIYVTQDTNILSTAYRLNKLVFVSDNGNGFRLLFNYIDTNQMFVDSNSGGRTVLLWETNHPVNGTSGRGDNSYARSQALGWWLNEDINYWGTSFQSYYFSASGQIANTYDGIQTIPRSVIENFLWKEYLSGSSTIQIEPKYFLANDDGAFSTTGQYIADWFVRLKNLRITHPDRNAVEKTVKIGVVHPEPLDSTMSLTIFDSGVYDLRKDLMYSNDMNKSYNTLADDLITTNNIVAVYERTFDYNHFPDLNLLVLGDVRNAADSMITTKKLNDINAWSQRYNLLILQLRYWLDVTTSSTAELTGLTFSANTTQNMYTGGKSVSYIDANDGELGLSSTTNSDGNSLYQVLKKSLMTVDNGNIIAQFDDGNILFYQYHNGYDKNVIVSPFANRWNQFDVNLYSATMPFFKRLYQYYSDDTNQSFRFDMNNTYFVGFTDENISWDSQIKDQNSRIDVNKGGYNDLWIWRFDTKGVISKYLERGTASERNQDLNKGQYFLFNKFNYGSFSLTQGSYAVLKDYAGTSIDSFIPVLVSSNSNGVVHIDSNLSQDINAQVTFNTPNWVTGKSIESITYQSTNGTYSHTYSPGEYSLDTTAHTITLTINGIEPTSSSNNEITVSFTQQQLQINQTYDFAQLGFMAIMSILIIGIMIIGVRTGDLKIMILFALGAIILVMIMSLGLAIIREF